MYQLHNTDQIAYIIHERRQEAAARQLAAGTGRQTGDAGRGLGPALQRIAALTRIGHLRARPARG
jgi:hypothetical protein